MSESHETKSLSEVSGERIENTDILAKMGKTQVISQPQTRNTGASLAFPLTVCPGLCLQMHILEMMG